ncbi:hypothetical protein BVRB_8g195800 [Beta vulgaris subsp. vulgaris]|nr:hypothetical protein BVRB_8g195800 [Beta vulgaris subsp. vulgaris]
MFFWAYNSNGEGCWLLSVFEIVIKMVKVCSFLLELGISAASLRV